MGLLFPGSRAPHEAWIDNSLMTYRMNFGQTISNIGYAWDIEGLKERVLIDAGVSVH